MTFQPHPYTPFQQHVKIVLVIALSHRDLMLATSAKAPFSANGWLFELKYDGFRLLVLKEGKAVRLLTRNGNDLAGRFPEIVADVRTLKGDPAIDGEPVVADEHGHPSFINCEDAL